MNEQNQNLLLPAAAASPQPCEMSDDEKIDAYVKLFDAAVKEHFVSREFQRRLDEAAQAEGLVPPGFDLDAYCGYDSAIVANRDSECSISREKAARIEGFMAGVAAERERYAKIAESMPSLVEEARTGYEYAQGWTAAGICIAGKIRSGE